MKIKMLVIQLTRIGDIIQTYQSCKQLKEENPDIELHLVVRKNFSSQLRFMLQDVFSTIYLLDRPKYTQANSLKESLSEMKIFLEDINSNEYNASINLSFCKTSSYLNSLVKTKVKLGSRYNLDAEIAIKDNWSQIVYSTVMGSTLNPFSLVDIYKRILGAKNNDAYFLNNKEKRNNRIVVHPFASIKKKKWGGNKWSELIYQILKHNEKYEIHVVGAPNETEESRLILESPILEKFQDRIFSHVGRKSIEQVSNLLSEASIFIGHDSMVGHLASINRTRSITISLGTVRPHETTFYGQGNINVVPKMNCFPCQIETACDHFKCHSNINYQSVLAVTNLILNNKEITNENLLGQVSEFHLNNISIFESYIDAELGMRLHSVIEEESIGLPQAFRDCYEFLWNLTLHNKETKIGIPKLSKDEASELKRYLDGVNNLYELQHFAINFANQLISEAESESPSINIIKELSEKMNEVDQLAMVSKKPFPYLSPIIDYYYVNKGNIEANNIVDVARHSLLTYHQASNSYAALYELIMLCIGPYAEPQTGRETEV